jgi:hypothetical protein
MHHSVYHHWIFRSALPHEGVCQLIRQGFGLSEFKFDHEVENDWAIAVKDGIEVNVTYDTRSRRRRLEETPTGLPDGSFVIIFTQKEDNVSIGQNWFLDATIATISQRIADLLNVETYYAIKQKTENAPRFLRFCPKST